MDYGSNDWLMNGFALFWVLVVIYGLVTGRFKQIISARTKIERGSAMAHLEALLGGWALLFVLTLLYTLPKSKSATQVRRRDGDDNNAGRSFYCEHDCILRD